MKWNFKINLEYLKATLSYEILSCSRKEINVLKTAAILENINKMSFSICSTPHTNQNRENMEINECNFLLLTTEIQKSFACAVSILATITRIVMACLKI